MFRAAIRRIVAVLAVVVGGTAAIAAATGALAGKSIAHSVAIGFYVVGATVLIGSFVLGVRGPFRPDWKEEAGVQDAQIPSPVRRRGIHTASAEERTESRRNSLGLFAFGLFLVLIGTVVDPSRRAF